MRCGITFRRRGPAESEVVVRSARSPDWLNDQIKIEYCPGEARNVPDRTGPAEAGTPTGCPAMACWLSLAPILRVTRCLAVDENGKVFERPPQGDERCAARQNLARNEATIMPTARALTVDTIGRLTDWPPRGDERRATRLNPARNEATIMSELLVMLLEANGGPSQRGPGSMIDARFAGSSAKRSHDNAGRARCDGGGEWDLTRFLVSYLPDRSHFAGHGIRSND